MFSSIVWASAFLGLVSAHPLAPRHDSSRQFASRRQASSEPVAASWYAGWHAQFLPPSGVSWDKYTHVTFAFAETTSDINSLDLSGSEGNMLPAFVQTAHDNDVKALISIGGWTGSRYFSPHVADASSRSTFVNTVLNLISNYSLDGVDFDWEYPGGVNGIGCNVNSTADTANFLSFLQELRAHPNAADLIITAAANIVPWVGSSLTPLTDVSGFADVLDWVEIMNYDVWGPFSGTTGPNAPLNDTCAPASEQAGSAVSAVAKWTAAGMPASQIVLGVPAYGHGFSVPNSAAFVSGSDSQLNPYAAFDKSANVQGDSWDSAGGTDVCGVTSNLYSGVFNFWGLIDGGFLTQNGTVAAGITYTYDECSQTPYVYNATSQVLVAFDDATSYAAKGDFILSAGLRGFAIWETAGDYNDILLDSIREAAGFDDEEDC